MKNSMLVDYSKIGLKVGLEVHQQLATQMKLFCQCKTQLFKGDPEITFVRRLRPTQSELGQIDVAALFEFQKGRQMLYEANDDTACLVEMDEEPPHNLNREAVDITLIVALMMKAKPVDEIHVMRKTVIDGSNTTGFQRTSVVALNGEIKIEEKKISIQHVSLEEGAARKIEEAGSFSRYRIDRLGIPLIEVTTAPVLFSPQEARNAALAIGRILRATQKVKRGIGTIRQDLNISIAQGALIEIKGVQKIELISAVIENEVQRQLGLLEIKNELRRREAKLDNFQDYFIDATSIFKNTKCKVIRRALDRNGRVLTVKLPKFEGLLKTELAGSMRLGKEMADIARFWGQVAGIFHSDEIPAYGISLHEVKKLEILVNKGPLDAIAIVVDNLEKAQDALKAIVKRAKEAIQGVPEETRAANPDGTSRFMRPRPGSARMYPETDVPPVQIEKDYVAILRTKLPELPEESLQRIIEEFKINTKLARQILNSELYELFVSLARKTQVDPTFVAVTLTETLKALQREGVQIDKITKEQLIDLFSLVASDGLAKEAIPEILTWLSANENETVENAVKHLNLEMMSQEELEVMIKKILEDSQTKRLVQQKGKDAFGPIMGTIMRKVRGRAKVELVKTILESHLDSLTK